MAGVQKEDVKAAITPKQVCDRLGVTVNRDDRISCPTPEHEDRDPSCKLYDTGWKCFACGAGGDVIDLYAHIRGLDFQQALTELAEHIGVEAPERPRVARKPRPTPDPGADAPRPVVPAPEPPEPGQEFKGRNTKGETKTYRPVLVHPYRNRDGELSGFICRVQTRSGKAFFTFQWYEDAGWCMSKYPEPTPLYGLERIGDSGRVILVEGEKCADALQALVKTPVLSWMGGAERVRKADLDPVRFLEVIVWPDNDAPGSKAADYLVEELGRCVVVQPEPERPKGWDVADFIEEGADRRTVSDYIKSNGRLRVSASTNGVEPAQPDPAPGGVKEVKPPPGPDRPTWPIRFLGYTGSTHLFQYKHSGRIIEKQAGSLASTAHLLDLMTIDEWEHINMCVDDGKLVTTACANNLLKNSRAAGLHNPKKMRGLGLWMDEGRAVLNLGDRLVVDGVPMSIGALDTKYVYVQVQAVECELDEPLTDEEGKQLIEAICSLPWQDQMTGKMAAGWCVSAMASGCLDWRSHISIHGPSGVGKTTVANALTTLTGPLGKDAASITAAALRRMNKYDAVATILDEFEADRDMKQNNKQAIIEYVRLASSGGNTYVTGQDGNPEAFTVRSSFATIGINEPERMRQDKTRTTMLALDKEIAKRTDWTDVADRLYASVHARTSRRLVMRIAQNMHVLRDNIATFSKAFVQKHPGKQREADQVSVLLAGAVLLQTTSRVSESGAQKLIGGIDWEQRTTLAEMPEHELWWRETMNAEVEVERADRGTRTKRTVYQLWAIGTGLLEDHEVNKADAKQALGLWGISVNHGVIRFDASAASPYTKKLKRMGSDYSGSWRNRARERGASNYKAGKILGQVTRVVEVEVPDEDDIEVDEDVRTIV